MPRLYLELTLSKHFVNCSCDMLGFSSGWSGSTNIINVRSLLKFLRRLRELQLGSFRQDVDGIRSDIRSWLVTEI